MGYRNGPTAYPHTPHACLARPEHTPILLWDVTDVTDVTTLRAFRSRRTSTKHASMPRLARGHPPTAPTPPFSEGLFRADLSEKITSLLLKATTVPFAPNGLLMRSCATMLHDPKHLFRRMWAAQAWGKMSNTSWSKVRDRSWRHQPSKVSSKYCLGARCTPIGTRATTECWAASCHPQFGGAGVALPFGLTNPLTRLALGKGAGAR